MKCLLCNDWIESLPKLRDLIMFNQRKEYSCRSCKHQFKNLSKERCQNCNKELYGDACIDCKLWMKKGYIPKHLAIYRYEENMKEYFSEKEARERRLAIYTEKIQETVLNKSAETIRSLVDERHNQKMTQQEISDITGIKPSNLARFESGGRVPTLIVLEKYANALGKHIEIKICDD